MKNNHVKPGGVFDRMLSKMTKPPPTDDRLSILAVELGLAGAQVLQEPPFNFTQKQATLWLDRMLDKAKVNRASSLAMMAVKQIDNEQS